MLYIARRKLARSAQHNLVSQQTRLHPHQCHGILQLIPETRGTTRLIETGFRRHAARQRLVQKPAIHQRIQQRIRSAYREFAQQRIPMDCHRLQALCRHFLQGPLC